jgi:hypothetical protein
VVYGGGEQLALSDQDVSVWSFTVAGMERLEREARQVLDRDYDTVLDVVLTEDLRAAE